TDEHEAAGAIRGRAESGAQEGEVTVATEDGGWRWCGYGLASSLTKEWMYRCADYSGDGTGTAHVRRRLSTTSAIPTASLFKSPGQMRERRHFLVSIGWRSGCRYWPIGDLGHRGTTIEIPEYATTCPRR